VREKDLVDAVDKEGEVVNGEEDDVKK